MRRPSSHTNSKDLGPKTPDVSIATGVKQCRAPRLLYLASFLSSAEAATSPASLVAFEECDGAKVSGHCNCISVCMCVHGWVRACLYIISGPHSLLVGVMSGLGLINFTVEGKARLAPVSIKN